MLAPSTSLFTTKMLSRSPVAKMLSRSPVAMKAKQAISEKTIEQFARQQVTNSICPAAAEAVFTKVSMKSKSAKRVNKKAVSKRVKVAPPVVVDPVAVALEFEDPVPAFQVVPAATTETVAESVATPELAAETVDPAAETVTTPELAAETVATPDTVAAPVEGVSETAESVPMEGEMTMEVAEVEATVEEPPAAEVEAAVPSVEESAITELSAAPEVPVWEESNTFEAALTTFEAITPLSSSLAPEEEVVGSAAASQFSLESAPPSVEVVAPVAAEEQPITGMFRNLF